MICPHCGENARFVEWWSKQFVSLFGPVALQFAYYHCKHCGRGCGPWCDKLWLSKGTLTLAAEEITSLAGVLGSFADDAERVLWKMAGLRLSASTVQRTTEVAGQRVVA